MERYFARQAAQYLGMSLRQFRACCYEKRLVQSDGRFGRRTWFWKSTLDELRKTLRAEKVRRDEEGRQVFTSSEAARMLGVSRQLFSYHLIRGNIVPDAHVDDKPVFLLRTVGLLRETVFKKGAR